MRRASGFTLIELLIVLALVLLLAGIGLTSLSSARLASNEAQAVAALRNVAVTETAWRQNDGDGNGRPDFWTGDWSGFHRVARKDGSPWDLIPVDLARADGAPWNETTSAAVPRVTRSVAVGGAVPFAGYFFRAMTSDNENPPRPYQDDSPTNATRFGFTAWPARPGSSGDHVFILVESGAIWARDLGGPGAGGPAPQGATLQPNAAGGQLDWPGTPGKVDLREPEDKAWRPVQ